MGLDLALGGLVLVMAIRGWLKGFLLQAIRLAGLVLCVYAADPVRDQIKPRVIGYLPTIRPELVDRMLWWSSAVAAYLIIVGLASLAVKLHRRQPYGMEEESRRGDQFAGSLLGIAKALVLAMFLVDGVEKYAIAAPQGDPRPSNKLRPRGRWLERSVSPGPSHLGRSAGPALRATRAAHGPNRSSDDAEQLTTAATEPALPVRTASRAPQLQLSVRRIGSASTRPTWMPRSSRRSSRSDRNWPRSNAPR